MRSRGQQQQGRQCGESRPTIEVIKEYASRLQATGHVELFEDYVKFTEESELEKIEAFIDGIDDEPYHVIHVASIWLVELPEQTSEHVIEAIRIINQRSAISTVSAFEFDPYFSMATYLELLRPVEEAHVDFALRAHIDLARLCIGPLFDIAFGVSSVHEVARLFMRPRASEMH